MSAKTKGQKKSKYHPDAKTTFTRIAGGSLVIQLTAQKKKTRKRVEAFIPEQRHLYGEERVFLPCPGSAR